MSGRQKVVWYPVPWPNETMRARLVWLVEGGVEEVAVDPTTGLYLKKQKVGTVEYQWFGSLPVIP